MAPDAQLNTDQLQTLSALSLFPKWTSYAMNMALSALKVPLTAHTRLQELVDMQLVEKAGEVKFSNSPYAPKNEVFQIKPEAALANKPISISPQSLQEGLSNLMTYNQIRRVDALNVQIDTLGLCVLLTSDYKISLQYLQGEGPKPAELESHLKALSLNKVAFIEEVKAGKFAIINIKAPALPPQ